ncbi:rhodanese-like domain-containing protein [Dokdonia sinensis]|nr:rhodanese-like domain-containing protein [Dokdonia sinensis]
MMRKLIIAFAFIGLVFFSGCKESKAQDTPVVQVIPVAQFESDIKDTNTQLIDVRTVVEYESGHIKGAKNIVYNSEAWNSSIEKLDKSKPVYVYCKKGGRSAKCASLLEEAGFTTVYDLNGGIMEWQGEGKPIEN